MSLATAVKGSHDGDVVGTEAKRLDRDKPAECTTVSYHALGTYCFEPSMKVNLDSYDGDGAVTVEIFSIKHFVLHEDQYTLPLLTRTGSVTSQ